MAFGTASFIAALYESGHPLLRRLAPALLLVIGLVGLDYARRHDVFTEAVGESKYVEVARVVESLTRPEDVIIASQHSGTLRYYAGRLTLR